MRRQNNKKIRKFLVLVLSIALLTRVDFLVLGAVMQSANYQIESDSLNIGGGDNQSSANYDLKDTIGEIASGSSSSTNYNLKAGYRQMESFPLSVSAPSDITLSPSIPSISGNPGNPSSGEALWIVTTDNPAGFNMKIRAGNEPAMKKNAISFFNDYTPETAGIPDYRWNTPDANTAEFGFTVEPETAADTDSLFLDNGSSCNAGALNQTNTCWYGFDGTNDIDIVYRNSRTDASGEEEVVKSLRLL